MTWKTSEKETYRSCPVHEDAKCVVIAMAEDDTVFKVKLHGSHWIGPDGKPLEFQTHIDAKDAVDKMLSALDFKPAQGTPKIVDTPAEQPMITMTIDPYSYNMFQVMIQDTPQHGQYVLVNSPRFGPLNPDQAINLAVWLRRYAEECGNLTKTFDELWNAIRENEP